MDALPVIKFYGPGTYFEFSNFYPAKVRLNGTVYPTTEHAYQAFKFLDRHSTERSREYAECIRLVNTPGKAKILANQKRVGGYKWRTDLNTLIDEYADVTLRTDWDVVRNEVMFDIVMAKFAQILKLRALLLSTGDALIQENSPRDSYREIGHDGTGSNHLGRILMKIRSCVRKLVSVDL